MVEIQSDFYPLPGDFQNKMEGNLIKTGHHRKRCIQKVIFINLLYLLTLLIGFGHTWAWPLPDTGQTKCYNDSVIEIPCPAPGQPFYGQDGNYTINPPSYTKLDSTGAALPNSATTWAMVKDNVTGLIWENKTDDGGIHDKDNTYTWCDRNPATNGGNQGTCGSGATPTDTEAFIKALNDARYGGFSDWRMPTYKELQSLVDFSRLYPAIDTTFFTGTVLSYYWTSTSHANMTSYAFLVYFLDGSTYYDFRSDSHYVRAVRGGQSGSLGHLVVNGDGTVTDAATGLMWQQGTSPSALTWEAALTYGEGLSLAGYDDWRMPTPKELQSIVDYGRWNPAIDTTFFPVTMSSFYWSSTTDAWICSSAWGLSFGIGHVSLVDKFDSYDRYYVRAVRAGQPRLLGHLIILSPGQADNWNIGEQKTIAWATAGIAGNVKITLSRQGGKAGTFETIIESTENDGMYNWTVTDPVSVNCILKMEPLNDPSKATSQGLFSIISVPVGTLVINPEPVAVNTAAPWTLTGPNSFSQAGMGDQTLDNLTPGDYTLAWGDAAGWTKPSPAIETKSLAGGGTTTFTGTYIQGTVKKCYNNTVEIPCPAPGESFYGQDGNYTINPPSYTKMDANGAALPDFTATWAMVKDNVTGLVWENKTDDDGIHAKDNTYTWCDRNPAINGGNQGTCGIGTGNAATDTEAFIKALNDAYYGGFSDWRMPTPKELLSIADFSRWYPAIDAAFFPGTVSSGYWSSATPAGITSHAWFVNFLYGGISYGNKSGSYHVRAVRGGQSGPSGRLLINGDGTVTDTATGLMWQQGSSPSALNWETALTYGEARSLAGYDDWRIPTLKELQSIVDCRRLSPPSIDGTVFPGTLSDYYWSSTTNALYTVDAWFVNFYYGDSYYDSKSRSHYVRAVRAGQFRLPGHLIISSPEQADRWNIGEQKTIAWATIGIAGNVKISISRQGGKTGTFETIIESTENDGSFDWTVAGPASVNCVLKIEPLNDPSKATSQGLFSVIDSPGTLQFMSATYSVEEESGSIRVYVTRTGGSSGAVGVSYATANGTATAPGDYTAKSGTLSWASGDAADKFVDVPINKDLLNEDSEIFTVTLSNPTGGAILGSPAATTVTISASTAIRSLPGYYSPGYPILVRVAVTPSTGVQIYAVQDAPPEGWTVSEINEGGSWDGVNKMVKWGPFFNNNARTLTYKANPPVSEMGKKTFAGSASFNGLDIPIGGTNDVDKGTFHPADTTQDNRIVINECTSYAFAWKTGATWAVEPNPIPIAYTTNACFLWKIGEVYHYDPNVTQGMPPYMTGEATSGVSALP